MKNVNPQSVRSLVKKAEIELGCVNSGGWGERVGSVMTTMAREGEVVEVKWGRNGDEIKIRMFLGSLIILKSGYN